MVLIIFCVLYFVATAFVLEYCYDKVDINALEIISTAYVPSLDETQLSEKNDLQNYINDIIVPAHKFIDLKNEIKELQSDDHLLMNWAFMELFGIVLMTFQINSLFSIKWQWCCVISICVCVLLCFVGTRLYRKSKYSIIDFGYTPDQFRNRYELELRIRYMENYNKYKIDEKQLWNICVINFQKSYLSSLRDTVVFRHSCRKIINVISFVMYLSFGLFMPEE